MPLLLYRHRCRTSAPSPPQVWPQDARQEPYYRYLYGQYDTPQREAIVAAASHLATRADLQQAAAEGVATGLAAAAAEGGGAAGGGGGGEAGGLGRGRGLGGADGDLPVHIPPVTLVQVRALGEQSRAGLAGPRLGARWYGAASCLACLQEAITTKLQLCNPRSGVSHSATTSQW